MVTTALALLGLFVFAHRLMRSSPSALGVTALFASSHAFLQWSFDGPLSPAPASLACVVWMLVLGGPAALPPWVRSRPWRAALAGALGFLACAMNPPMVVAVAGASIAIAQAERQRGANGSTALLALLQTSLALAPFGLIRLIARAPWPLATVHAELGARATEPGGRALRALREALIAPAGLDENPALTSAAALGFAALFVVSLLAIRGVGPRMLRSLPLLVAAVILGALSTQAYVDPPVVWLSALWLFALAWVVAIDEERGLLAPLRFVSPVVCGLMLAANVAGRVGSTRAPEGDELFRRRIPHWFRKFDLVVFPEWPDSTLLYQFGIPSTGWLALKSMSRSSDTTLSTFIASFEQTTNRGGRVWIAVDDSGAPLLPKALDREREALTDTDLGRLLWGLTLVAGRSRWREVVAILRQPACSSAGHARPAVDGVSVFSPSWVERDTSEAYRPERAFDNDPSTEWLALDRHAFIELYLASPRPVREVRLLNADNAPFHDFETRVARVSAWHDQHQLTEARVELKPQRWQTLNLTADEVTCIQVAVVAAARRGGGFAEIEIR